MSVRRSPLLLAWLSLALPVAMTAGCKDEGAAAPAPSVTAEAVKAPIASAAATGAPSAAAAGRARNHQRGRGGGGLTGNIFRAAQELELKDAQKATVEKLGEPIHAEAAPVAEMKEYHVALLAQVRAGKIELAKLEPLQAALEKAQQARKDKEAEALNGLHAALEPAQRKALVASVRAKQSEHGGPRGEPPSPADRLAHLTKDVDLDAAQQKKVEPLLAKDAAPPSREEMKKHTEAVLTAFEGEGFDAKKVEPAAAPAGKGMAAQHAQFLAALVPLLKPEQREKLAASLEKQRGGEHGGGPGGEEPADAPPATP
jgi:Spy/CpxP family protein refolding chaperone